VFRGGSRRGQSTACACTPRRGFGGTGRWTGGRRPFLKAKHDEDDPEDEEEDEEDNSEHEEDEAQLEEDEAIFDEEEDEEDNSEHEEDEAQLEEDEAIFDQETITDAENIRCGPWPLCVFRRP
jgi:hypothetical protein